MYIFIIFLSITAIAIPVVYLREKKRSREVKEKSEGKWDFVDREYLPYLQSQGEVVAIESLSFTIKWDSYKWNITGKLYFNDAGVYAKFNDVGMFNAPTEIFIWGKSGSGRLKALHPLYFHSIEEKSDTVVVRLRTKETVTTPNYTLTVSSLSPGAITQLKEVLRG